MTKSLPIKEQVTDLVWLQTGFLGDIVLNTAAMALAANLLPQSRQHLITTGIGAAALKDHSHLHSIILFDKRRSVTHSFRQVKSILELQLKDRNHTVLLRAHRSFRSAFLGQYLQLPTVSYAESNFAFLSSQTVPRLSSWHEAHRIGLLLEPLGVLREDILKSRPNLSIASKMADSRLQQALDAMPGKLIGIAPGSVWGTKRWPIEYFCALVNMLLAEDNTSIALIGSTAEQLLADTIMERVKGDHARILNLAGKTNLDDLRYAFPKLHLMVTNDSAPLHYASAFNVPTIALFGATIPAFGFGPLADTSSIFEVSTGLTCRPCSDHGPQVCPLEHFQCMKSIEPLRVFTGCRGLLESTLRQKGPVGNSPLLA